MVKKIWVFSDKDFLDWPRPPLQVKKQFFDASPNRRESKNWQADMGEFLTKFGRSDSGDGKFVDPTNMLISDQLDLRRESIYPRQEVGLDLHIALFLCSWAKPSCWTTN